jgi:hypothetical protein
MAQRISSVIATYQQQLADMMPFILSMPYGWAVLGQDSVANKLFLTLLFSNKEVGVEFLETWGSFMARWCVIHVVVMS